MTQAIDWQPSASKSTLIQRARLLKKIREFLYHRQVLEVETPLLCQYGVTDPHLNAFRLPLGNESRFLQTSPEFAMKRLLAADMGSIYQICKAFRADDLGSRHNPEFTLLEWYRVDFDHWQLMTELDALLQECLEFKAAEKISYHALFYQQTSRYYDQCSNDELASLISGTTEVSNPDSLSKDDWLNLIMATLIEPNIGQQHPVFVYDYPASQAALAKIDSAANGMPVAARFELFYRGLELANGYWELTDAKELSQRYHQDNKSRGQMGLEEVTPDPYLLAAMTQGLPNCAGVAVGIDRLLLAKHLEAEDAPLKLSDWLSFDWHRA